MKEFDYAVVDFGNVFVPSRNKTVPTSNRISNSSSQITIWGNKKKEIRKCSKEITRLANIEGNPYEQAESRFEYQKNLYCICRPMVEEASEKGYEDTMVLLLERGAILIGAFYDSPKDQIARVVAKRLDRADGSFGLGLSNMRFPESKKNYRKLYIHLDHSLN